MKKILILSIILLASCTINKVVQHHGVHNLENKQNKLKVNQSAPNFKLESTDGNIFELNKIKKKNIILYFYPKDDTPGCTLESRAFSKLNGLILRNMYLTTALKCVPPGDKPTSKELKTCFNYFNKEIGYLKNVRVIVALGKIGYDACLNYYKQYYQIKNKDFIFSHGSKNILPDNKLLVGSYHPSPRNVNTGRINQNKMVKLLNNIKEIL